MTDEGRRRGRSVSRLLAIVEAFGSVGPALTIAQISARTGIPSPTVYRLTADLAALDAVERLPDGRYAIGLRLWEVVKVASGAERLAEVASPALRDLHDVARGGVALAVLAGGDALYVHTLGTHETESVRPGRRAPLTSTSIGQALLAYAPIDQAEPVLAGIAEAVGRQVADLQDVLAEVRRVGAAVSRTTADSIVIAAPVCGPSGSALAAVALTGPAGAESRLIPLVRMTARRIARDIAAAAAH